MNHLHPIDFEKSLAHRQVDWYNKSLAQRQVYWYNEKIPFVHFTPTRVTALWAQERFVKALGYHPPNFDNCTFIVAEVCGRSVNHVPVLILEDTKEWTDQRIVTEALLVAAPMNGIQPLILWVTRIGQ